jgi:iron complex outermembrane receptor protein
MRGDAIKRCFWPMAVAGQLVWPAVSIAAAADTETSNSALEEVVVTATRRSERLQDVPISVTAFSQEKLDSQGLRSIDDLTRLSPGVVFERNGMGSSANYNDENSDISIRGVDSQAGTSTTGIYIDDTPVQSRHIGFGAVNVFPALFDLDRVEVLRGPQGTLFGAGAEGGVVRFITPQPSLTKDSGYLRSEIASTKAGDASYEVGAAAGGPIINDVLGFRISASFRRDGGWVDRANYSLTPNPENSVLPTPVLGRVTETDANWQETITFRAALKWAVNDAVSVTPSFYYQQLHINDTAAYWVGLSNPSSDTYYNGNQLTNPSRDPFSLSAVKVDWDLGFAQLTSNSSYFERRQHSTSDYSQYLRATYAFFGLLPTIYPQPGDAGYATFEDDQQNFYQEFRLASSDTSARLVWNTGVFYSHLNENIPENIFDQTLQTEIINFTAVPGPPVDICAAPLTCPNGEIFAGPIDRVVDKQLAAFGEVTFKFTDALKATVGVRVAKVDFTGSTYAGGPFLGTANSGTQASSSEKPVTPKGVLTWQPDRNNLYYLSATKGYRVGGVNVGVGDICGGDLQTLGLPLGSDGLRHVPTQFASDNLWSYEIGGKNTFFDHRLQIDSSLFLINWKNIQQNVYLPSCGEQFTANLGQVQSRGGDIDVQFRPIDTLTLGLTVAYTDARFTKSSCAGILQFSPTAVQPDGVVGACAGVVNGAPTTAPPVVSEGNRIVGAPWNIMLAAEKTFGAWDARTPYVRADYQFTTAQSALLPGQDSGNALFDTSVPGLPQTKNLSLRAGFRWSGYDLSFFAQNVLDQHPLLFTSRDIAYNAPRRAGHQRAAVPGAGSGRNPAGSYT